jgi:hypothetical protein
VDKVVHLPLSLSKIASELPTVSTCIYRLSIYIFNHDARQPGRETGRGDILSTFVHLCPHVRQRKRPTPQTAATPTRLRKECTA